MSQNASTENNTTQNDTTCQGGTLPIEWGDSPVTRLTKFYTKQLSHKMGTSPTVQYGKLGKIFKSLLKQIPEIQLAVYLMAHFNYNTHKGDEFLAKRLKERLYPIELFSTNINIYKTYLIYEKGIEIDDIDNLQEIVYNYIDKL